MSGCREVVYVVVVDAVPGDVVVEGAVEGVVVAMVVAVVVVAEAGAVVVDPLVIFLLLSTCICESMHGLLQALRHICRINSSPRRPSSQPRLTMFLTTIISFF